MAPHPVAPLPAKLQLVSPSALKKPPKILIKSINPHIICYLCKGYLVDATTIVECLHSFCHSCIMKHLQLENYCPRCEMLINKAKPNIKPDATLQAIVYKLVSGLYEKELKRKRAFYREHPYEAMLASPEQRGDDTEHLIFSPNEQISLSLEYADLEEITPEDDENENITELKHPKYLQCPANFPVAYLKKFVINKFNINVKDFFVEIMYKVKTIVLPDHFTLMDVAYIYTWKRDAPMRYFYRVRSHHIETEEVLEVPLCKSSPIQTTPDENTQIKSVVNESDTIIISNNDLIKVDNKPVKSTHATSNNSKNSDNHSGNTSSSEVKKKSKKDRNISNDNEKNGDSLKLVIDLANQKVKESPSVNSSSTKSSYNSEQCDNKDELKLKITKIHTSSLPSPKTPSPKDKSPKIKEPQTPTKSDTTAEKSPKMHAHVGKPQDPEKVIEVKKFEFLNSFELTAKKSISDAKPTPSVTTTNSAAKLFTIPTTSSVHHATVTSNAAPPDQPKIKITLSKNKPKQMTLSSMLKRKRMSSPNGSTTKVSYKIKDKKSCSVSPPLLMSSKDTNRSVSEPNESAKSISFNLAPYPIGTTSSTSPNKQNSSVTTNAPSDQKPNEVQTTSVSNQEPKVAEARKSASPTKTKEEKKAEKQNMTAPNKISTPPPPALPEVVKLVGSKASKSEGLMKPPQLPPPSVKRPQPILPKQPVDSQYSNKMMNLAGTEIKKLENNERNKNVKVYGPTETKSHSKHDKMAPPLLSFTGGVMRNSMSGGFLNYALMNSSKSNKTKIINGGGNGGDSPHPNHIPLSRMTPASHYAGMKSPRYVPNSPIYSPNSPQYAPNYNIPTQPQYKYMKPPVYASPNFLQNVMPPKNSPSTSANASSTQGEHTIKAGMKRQLSPLSLFPSTSSKQSPKHDKSDNISPPPEKQAKVQSLLDSCKISLPSSLSITLTNDKEDQPANQLFNKNNSSPVNNYIEILKLSENNEEERSFSESLKTLVEEKKLLKPIPNLTPMVKTTSSAPTTPELSPNQKNSKNISSYQDCYIQAMEKIKTNINKKFKPDDAVATTLTNKSSAANNVVAKKTNGSTTSAGNGRPRIKVTGAAKQQQQLMLQMQQQQAQINQQQQTPPTPTSTMEQMLALQQQAQDIHNSHTAGGGGVGGAGHLPQLSNNNNLDNLFYSLPQLPAYLNEASRRAFASQLANQLANRALWEHKAYENYYYNNNKQLSSETGKDNPTESI